MIQLFGDIGGVVWRYKMYYPKAKICGGAIRWVSKKLQDSAGGPLMVFVNAPGRQGQTTIFVRHLTSASIYTNRRSGTPANRS
jgi:hypothetical protein